MAQRILVTGGTGSIGRAIVPALREAGHHVRVLRRTPSTEPGDDVVGDLTDASAVDAAVSGMDQVIHLAANPHTDATFPDLVDPNVVGLYHVADASARHGVRRLVLASTINTVNHNARTTATPHTAPVTWYGLSKVWAEQMGEMIARLHGVEVIAARIGWFLRNTTEYQRMAERVTQQRHYVSHRDMVAFFRSAVEAQGWPDRLTEADLITGPVVTDRPPFAVVFATGPGLAPGDGPDQPPEYDLEPGRRLLGYDPQDRWPDGSSFD